MDTPKKGLDALLALQQQSTEAAAESAALANQPSLEGQQLVVPAEPVATPPAPPVVNPQNVGGSPMSVEGTLGVLPNLVPQQAEDPGFQPVQPVQQPVIQPVQPVQPAQPVQPQQQAGPAAPFVDATAAFQGQQGQPPAGSNVKSFATVMAEGGIPAVVAQYQRWYCNKPEWNRVVARFVIPEGSSVGTPGNECHIALVQASRPAQAAGWSWCAHYYESGEGATRIIAAKRISSGPWDGCLQFKYSKDTNYGRSQIKYLVSLPFDYGQIKSGLPLYIPGTEVFVQGGLTFNPHATGTIPGEIKGCFEDPNGALCGGVAPHAIDPAMLAKGFKES